jgi:N-acetylmuramic acid 6-phosphate etherase
VDADVAATALEAAGNEIRQGVAVAMGLPLDEARALLEAHGGSLRDVLQSLRGRA